MTLWLTHDQARAIAQHARRERPNEACGLVAGAAERAAQVIPVPNTAADPQRCFEMDSVLFARAVRDIQRAGLRLIAIYHSHPNTDPVPSPADIACAAYPNTVYLIVSLRGPDASFAAWRFHGSHVEKVDLHIGNSPPPPLPEPLTSAGRVAVTVAALTAVVFFIVLALTLLPPAPPLP